LLRRVLEDRKKSFTTVPLDTVITIALLHENRSRQDISALLLKTSLQLVIGRARTCGLERVAQQNHHPNQDKVNIRIMHYNDKKKKVKKSNQKMGPLNENEMNAVPFNNAAIKKIMMNRQSSSEGAAGTVFKTKKPKVKA
jgi:hypothetical protein